MKENHYEEDYNFVLEIKIDYQNYIRNKKFLNLIMRNMKTFACTGSFGMSAKDAVKRMLEYNDEIRYLTDKIERFESRLFYFDYDEQQMIEEMFDNTSKELAELWNCCLRSVYRKEKQIENKYRSVKYGKIVK